jgi:phosphotransferase system enzyme I (PtsI)
MTRKRTKIFHGIDASPGIGVGLVHLADQRSFQIPKRRLRQENVAAEKARFRQAVLLSISQLTEVRNKLSVRTGKESRAILDSHLMMLQDDLLIGGTEKVIAEEQVNAEWALQKKIAAIHSMFDNLQDEYFRERRADVEFVGARILRNLMGYETELRQPAHERAVVVAHSLSPVDTATLSKTQVAGFVLEVGGKTSHTAIIARAMEIPAVAGAEGILAAVAPGEHIIVDGYRGEVVVNPDEQAVHEALVRAQKIRERAAELASEPLLPAATTDDHPMRLTANIEAVEDAKTALRYGAEGIGLFRTEFLFMGKRAPSERHQLRCYQSVLRRMKDRPVTIRTMDVGGEKKSAALKIASEANPALGLRAIRLSFRYRQIFLSQLRALLRASVEGPLKILFPMISCLQELRAVKDLVEEARQQLKDEGQKYGKQVKFGIMIEVPSAALASAELAREVDFFSIGTNDLIQFTLAVDRHNQQVAYLYNPLDISVLRLLKMTVDNAHAAGIPVCLCGEMAGDPLYLHVLLGLEIDEISMNPSALPYAHHLIRCSRYSEAKDLTNTVLAMNDATAIRQVVQEWMAKSFPEFFTPTGHADILGGL